MFARFNDNQVPQKMEETGIEEKPKKKLVRDLKQGDRVKLPTGEIYQMSSVEVMNGRFFAFNIDNENDRKMLKASEVEII